MPSLDPEDRRRLLVEVHACHLCDQRLRRNYCRQCDEFFYEGHHADCPGCDTKHTGHRTYDLNTRAPSWIQDLVEDFFPPSILRVGERFRHKGRVVEVTGGQYWGLWGVSNHWHWRPVLEDGSLGPEEDGYDNEGAFSPVA
jgi:hypothetical protein